VQQNAESVNAALKTGGAAATPASTLDAKAAQQSQQMLSAMATQSQTATPTALAAPDLQPKPQLVASQV
jgi:iron-regulated protein frpC